MSIDGLAERFAKLLATMREDSLASVALLLDSAEAARGGAVVIQAPCAWKKRGIAEAGFRSEGYNDLT